jgi:hypothetical protein
MAHRVSAANGLELELPSLISLEQEVPLLPGPHVPKVGHLLSETWVLRVIEWRVKGLDPDHVLPGEAIARLQPSLVVLLRDLDQARAKGVVHHALRGHLERRYM